MKKYNQRIIPVVIIVSILLAFTKLDQGHLLLKKVQDSLVEYALNAPEKTFIQTDRSLYELGDTLWLKTYLINGITHLQSDMSKVAYVELLNSNDSAVAKRKLFVDGKSASGDIVLDDLIGPGRYRLRAFSKYMLNDKNMPVFEKNITVSLKGESTSENNNSQFRYNVTDQNRIQARSSIIKNKINLKFFPEGGHLVEGLPGVLGFEVLDADGIGLSVTGNIYKSDSTLVKKFESADFGLGKINFTPEKNETYHAIVKHENSELKFDLPASLYSGFSLNVRNRGEDMILQVSATSDKSLDGTLLVGHLRGKLIFERIGNTSDKLDYAVKLMTTDLPNGVASFTLFTPSGEPVCERLVFVNNSENSAQITLASENRLFNKKDKVKVDVLLLDEKGKALQGDFSVSVSKAENISNGQTYSMKSWLLLDSDLGGTVKNPNFFFKDDSGHTQYMRDALMLTHGWRRFVWKELIEDEKPILHEHEPEKGIMITGAVSDFTKKSPLKFTPVSLSVVDRLFEDTQTTTEESKFSFGPYIYNDTLEAVLQSVNPASQSKNLGKKASLIQIDPVWPSVIIKGKSTYMGQEPNHDADSAYENRSFNENVAEYRPSREVTRLKNVTVKTKKKSLARRINEQINKTTPYGEPSLRIFRDSITGWETLSVLELIARKGYTLGSAPSSVLARTGPLVTVDGTNTSLSLVDLKYMRANEVKYIDILRFSDVNNAIYGARGSRGAIAIYTKLPREVDFIRERDVPGIAAVKIPGFYKAKEFYIPNYEIQEHDMPDLRTTLLWEPNLVIKRDGSTNLEFFTSDSPGQYVVTLEGIADNGELINENYLISVSD